MCLARLGFRRMAPYSELAAARSDARGMVVPETCEVSPE